jgi:hypothetical protein
MNPHLFYRNHLSQETTAFRPAPDSSRGSLSSAGARSLSAPSAELLGGGLGGGLDDGSAIAAADDALLRKYMPAGQRVRGPSTAVDEVTGLVGLNYDPGSGGIWAALADASVSQGSGAPAPARRMRARGSQPLQSAQAAAYDDALAAKMRWDPAAEQRKQEQRAREAAAWEASRSPNPTGGDALGGRSSPARRARKPVAHQSPSLNLGWPDAAAAQASGQPTAVSARAPAAPAAPAPWLQEDKSGGAAAMRPGRRAVDGKDSQQSRITWEGYGKNDPVRIARLFTLFISCWAPSCVVNVCWA